MFASILRIVPRFLPLGVLLLIWEYLSDTNQSTKFFFSSPSEVIKVFVEETLNGRFPLDLAYTLIPTVIGFLIGVGLGTASGLLLGISGRSSLGVKSYVNLVGNIPIFAIAPMMIVWFGIGLPMKIALATFSTFFVALAQAYNGCRSITPRQLADLYSLTGSSMAVMRYLLLPGALVWIFSGMRITTNLALLGTFVGEFMASERGLGRVMLSAGSLYNVALVLAAAFWMIILVLALNGLVFAAERARLRIIEFVSVDRRLWRQEC
jgi:NitT/TauT family transport system permease protein